MPSRRALAARDAARRAVPRRLLRRSSSTAATTRTPASSRRRPSRARRASRRVTRKATGEFYAQLRAERDNPKADVWYGGTIDPFLQGAAEGLFARVSLAASSRSSRRGRSAGDRAHRLPRRSRSTGSSSASASIPRCSRSAARARRAAGRTSCSPSTANEIELSNPVTSGTGYTILATLVALYGEDGAFAYLKRLDANVVRYTQSGTAQGPSVARGEVAVGVTLRRTSSSRSSSPALRSTSRFPARAPATRSAAWRSSPARPHPDGGARVLRLGADGSARGARESHAQPDPPGESRRRRCGPRPRGSRMRKSLDLDPARFGAPAERKRLLARWQREIGDAPH